MGKYFWPTGDGALDWRWKQKAVPATMEDPVNGVLSGVVWMFYLEDILVGQLSKFRGSWTAVSYIKPSLVQGFKTRHAGAIYLLEFNDMEIRERVKKQKQHDKLLSALDERVT